MTTVHRTLSEAVNNNIDNMARVALEWTFEHQIFGDKILREKKKKDFNF